MFDNLLKVLKHHLPHCKMHEFSLQKDRHCTCGVEGARRELQQLLNLAWKDKFDQIRAEARQIHEEIG